MEHADYDGDSPGDDNDRDERRFAGELSVLLRIEPCPKSHPEHADHGDRKPPIHHGEQPEHAYGKSDHQCRGDIAEPQSPRFDERERALQRCGQYCEQQRLQHQKQRIEGNRVRSIRDDLRQASEGDPGARDTA